MLIKFSVSNFLSFNEKQELSLEAGKARKFSNRIYNDNKLKLVKCQALFGSNGSGKSNLVKALHFIQRVVVNGFPKGFSNQYYRLSEGNRLLPSEFEIEILCNDKHLCYGFSAALNIGSIEKEWLYVITPSGLKKEIFKRDVTNEIFTLGDFFKEKEAKTKLKFYGEDSVADYEYLFLTIINMNKGKMFAEYKELSILKDIYDWFDEKLTVSFPEEFLQGSPYFSLSNQMEIAEILNALGTGITNIRVINVPKETVKNKMPEEIFDNIISNLEIMNARAKKENEDVTPAVVARAHKEFYTFEIDKNNDISVKTLEFEHGSHNVYFSLNEESDGTARLLDLIEILFKISSENIYVIDEIDRCLHPAMTTKVIDLFLKMAEERNTQLIITTHESRLLKEDILRNDEICFMLKSPEGSTIIHSLLKNPLRADKKIYEALFDGTINALPNFNETKITKFIYDNLN